MVSCDFYEKSHGDNNMLDYKLDLAVIEGSTGRQNGSFFKVMVSCATHLVTYFN